MYYRQDKVIFALAKQEREKKSQKVKKSKLKISL